MPVNQTEFVEEMLEHYLICALWSSMDNADPSGGEPLDANYDTFDIATESRAKALEECTAFVMANAALLENISAKQAGHDFWLTRNGHGAGFWDRGLGEVGERLTKACKMFESKDAIIGDDNKIYFE
jgi:hypothetical protein